MSEYDEAEHRMDELIGMVKDRLREVAPDVAEPIGEFIDRDMRPNLSRELRRECLWPEVLTDE